MTTSRYQKKQMRPRTETIPASGPSARDDVAEACREHRRLVVLPSHSELDVLKLSAIRAQLERLDVDPFEEPGLRAQLARWMSELAAAESEEGPLSTSAYLEHWRATLRSRCEVLRMQLGCTAIEVGHMSSREGVA